MKIHSIPVDQISVRPNRQRREFNPEKLAELAASIDTNGLIHPIVVRKENDQTLLVAGERRLRALEYVWGFGGTVRCGTQEFPEGSAPCLWLGEIDPVEAFEIELEENIKREDLSWQDRARATADLVQLRSDQAKAKGLPLPTTLEIAQEITPEGGSINTKSLRIKKDLILARNLDNPEVAKAKSADEGLKVLIRQESARRNEKLSQEVGRTFSSNSHTLYTDDCLQVLPTLTPESFDVILSDPPYGMNAQDFGDSAGVGGVTPGIGGHLYDDSPENWLPLMTRFLPLSYSLAKPQAHLYLFCDIDRYFELRDITSDAGWQVFRTPLVWHNPQSSRAPWPDQGPQRKYQICLYAVKGHKPTNFLKGDVLVYPSDPNLGHKAQKPVPLLCDLLARSTRPGDSVLDPFCGSGSIFPACHQHRLRATGIEQDPVSAGTAARRIQELT